MYQYHNVAAMTSDRVTAPRNLPRLGILLHSTEGLDSLEWLQGGSARKGKAASADYLISRLGDVFQLTRAGNYSYHAGDSLWRRRNNDFDRLNQWLVGIEVESHHTNLPRYMDSQLIALAALVRALMAFHGLSVTDIDYHGRIAVPAGRRSDPVAFPAHTWTNELLQPSREQKLLVFPAVLP